MIVYHGSNVIVDHPRLINQNRTLDFGFGFYTTSNLNQAISFAKKVTDRSKSGSPCVNMYGVSKLEELKNKYEVLIFQEANEEWLDFVSLNRNGKYFEKHYDIIYGPVANDTIYQTFAAYEGGILTKEETIARLKVRKLYNQIVFASNESLKELKYIGQYK